MTWTVLENAGPWELGEGLRATSRGLVAVDLLAGKLYRLGLEHDREPAALLASVPFPLGAVAPIQDSDAWIAAADTGVAVLNRDGTVEWLARPEDDAPTRMRMNDGVTDPSGRFWAGSMAYDGTRAAGSLYRVDHDGSVHTAVEDLTVPNGPAFTPDGRTMYLADSADHVIYRVPVDPSTGEPGEREVFARVPDGSPDGMVVDAEGCLWSAVWGASAVHRYAPTGDLLASFSLPARQPTSVCLTLSPPHRVLVTTATYGLDAPAPAEGHVLTSPSDVGGHATVPFRYTPQTAQ